MIQIKLIEIAKKGVNMVFWRQKDSDDFPYEVLEELCELLALDFDEEQQEERLKKALEAAKDKIKRNKDLIVQLDRELLKEEKSVDWLAQENDLLNKELSECRLDNPTSAVKGILKFIDQGGNKVANTVEVNVAQTVVATVDWVDSRGNVAVAPANVTVASDTGVSGVLNADGTVTFTPSGALGDNNVSVSGDGIATPATGVISVIAGPAASGALNFGTPA